MCGIAGYLARSGAPDGGVIRAMTDTLAHRGPDSSDVWLDEAAGAALGHRRLAILDLSPAGAQPMHSSSGRWVTVYNGEIYNHLELRKELGGDSVSFRGGSDTETLLACVEAWGVEATARRCVGMFAIVLWDRKERTLWLVRDRLGIKPLFYGRVGGDFAFGSELKALRAHPGFDNPVDRGALSLYFRHNYVPAPHSIYEGVRKQQPGTILRLGPGMAEPEETVYWSALDVWLAGQSDPLPAGDPGVIDELEALLTDAVEARKLSDVPLGAFLSGGIDSSTVAALMQKHSTQPVRTFTIGFRESGYNEADHARAVAKHLGTDHTELTLTPQDLLHVVPDMGRYYDEPFSDSSQIPTFCLSRMTREHVTVSLSGDGGDELFHGYERYRWGATWEKVSRVPLPFRRLAALGRHLPVPLFRLLGSIGPKIHWRLDALALRNFKEFYRFFLSHHRDPARFVLGGHEPLTGLTDPAHDVFSDLYRQMSFWDVVTYLPDDILTKVDRASMAVSLEARVPLLDHRVVEYAARFTSAELRRDGSGKLPLRQVLYRHVPRELVDRPKKGFGVPVQEWMRSELRDWCEDLLDDSVIRSQGYLDATEVQRMWNAYLAGQPYYSHHLWDVLMFQAWAREAGV